MPRPICDERLTIRIPSPLLAVLLRMAARQNSSLNHVALTCFENELGRLATYHLDYYNDLMPLLSARQGDHGGQCSLGSDRQLKG